MTDALGNQTRWQYDAMDRIERTTDGEGGQTRNVYDNQGNLRFVVTSDRVGDIDTLPVESIRVTEYRYDGRNRVVLTIQPHPTAAGFHHPSSLVDPLFVPEERTTLDRYRRTSGVATRREPWVPRTRR